jgi:Cys-tRNA(Pro)/Cys-tRNA(Cys) deacylase
MTPAVARAKKAGIFFSLHEYDHDPLVRAYGLEAAEKLGVAPGHLFKTLVADVRGKGLTVAVVPVSGQLDLKALARVMNGKKAAMAQKVQVEKTTGYLAGGVSPIGQKKALPTVIDVSAQTLSTLYVSAGKRGLQIQLDPSDLAALTRARFFPISKPA